ncbi:MAG: gliding motility-associated C-terminal domain-containing protein [Cytophagaceae bacterium]|nr:gliding motility-associated C-terminal domain-containing protein [Cytophagaceae bacterium]
MLRMLLISALVTVNYIVLQAQCFYNSTVSYGTACQGFLQNVVLNEMNNSISGCSSGYVDYTPNTSLRPTLYRGTLDTIYLRVAYGYYDMDVALFFDWNNNNTYDEGEYYHVGRIYTYDNFDLAYRFSVPTTITSGSVRMRVRASYFSNVIGSDDLCTTLPFGETEDYLVQIADKDMAVSYTTMQPTDIQYATKNQSTAQVLRIEVTGNGSQNPKQLDSLYFRFPSTVSPGNFSSASILKTNTIDFINPSFVGSLSNPGRTFAFTNLASTIDPGMNYYWLSLQVNNTADIGDTLDAISDSIFTSGVKLIPTQNDPFGIIRVDYCRNSYNTLCYQYLSKLSIGTYQKQPGCSNGYLKDNDFIGFNRGAKYYVNLSTTQSGQVGFMIDFNADGDFNDNGEFSIWDVLEPYAPVGFPLQIPANAHLGAVRMRITSANSLTQPDDACSAFEIYDADLLINESSNMYVDLVSLSNASKKLVEMGETNALASSFKINTSGSSNPISLQRVHFNLPLNTNPSSIKNAKLWTTGGFDQFDPDSLQLVGSVNSPGTISQVNGNASLYTGSTYFWLTFDIQNTVGADEKFDVDIDSLIFNSDSYSLIFGDMEGYLQVSDTSHLKDGVFSTCRTVLYDDGGKSGDYTASNKTMTLYTTAKRYFELYFREFDLASDGVSDSINIWNGDTPGDGTLIGSFKREQLPSGVYTSSDSIITIEFVSSNSNTRSGFALELACRFNCNTNPIGLSYVLTDPICEGGMQKVRTQISSTFTSPLHYRMSAFGALEYDSLLIVNSPKIDTAFYIRSHSIAGQSYRLYVVDSNECKADLGVFPGSSVNSLIKLNPTQEYTCPYEATGSIALAASNLSASAIYTWSGDTVATGTNLNGLKEGIYHLNVVDENGCKDTTFVIYSEQSIQTPSAIIGPNSFDQAPGEQKYTLPALPSLINEGDDRARINPLITNSPFSYKVSLLPSAAGTFRLDSNQLFVNYHPNFDGTATLYLQYELSTNGCMSRRSVPLIVSINSEKIIPSQAEAAEAFSPNGDGKNEFFVFKNLVFENNKLIVYNREGHIVFETKNYENNWDGTFQNDGKTPLPDGTYYYVLRNEQEEEKFKGYVEIRRK